MSAALLLLCYAWAAGQLGRQVLRGTWSSRSPRAAVVVWQSLCTSVVLAVLLAVVALALPFLPLRFSVAYLLGAQEFAVIEHYGTPWGIWPAVVALALVAACAGRLVLTTARGFTRARRVRRSQLDTLALVGRPHPDGYTVVDHEVPVAYCLPGGAGTVVMSTGATSLLTDRERELVLGHERRHLRARHDLALAYSDALARTFPVSRLFAEAHDHVRVLLEMAADDSASGTADRRTLATALVVLSTGVRPDAALAAADTAALQRVRRLTSDARPGRGVGPLAGLASVVALALPVGIALAPAVEAATRECCTIAALTPEG